MNYLIQAGDTLSAIASKHGTTVAALLAANPSITNANTIRAGASLNIPVGGSSAPAAPPATNTPAKTSSPVANFTPVTLGNGAQVYVDPQGTYHDKSGAVIPNSAIAASTANSSTPAVAGASTSAPTSSSSSSGGNTTGTSGYNSVSSDQAAALKQAGISSEQWNSTLAQYGGSVNNGFNNTWLSNAMSSYKPSVITTTSTGDASLDQILGSIAGVANGLVSNGYTIPANLKITPDLVSQFLAYAHQAIDPYTQQLLTSRIKDVNANLAALATQYGNQVGERTQQFGTDLATSQNTAGANGTAFSGLRNVNELNLAASANRDLSNLGNTAALNMGTIARAGAADVGSTNASSILLPSLSTGTVSLTGGSRGSSGSGNPLDVNYDPSLYKVGTIPSNQTEAVNKQQQNYLSQFGTLAGATSNSGRSVSDLFGLMSGLPSGYQVPSNLT